MKKIAVLVTVITSIAFTSAVEAEDVQPGSVSVGVHGIGGEWNAGRPTVRWRESDTSALDFTPVASMTRDGGAGDGKADTYGLNVGFVRQFGNRGGMFLGWRGEIGYIYATAKGMSASTGTPCPFTEEAFSVFVFIT